VTAVIAIVDIINTALHKLYMSNYCSLLRFTVRVTGPQQRGGPAAGQLQQPPHSSTLVRGFLAPTTKKSFFLHAQSTSTNPAASKSFK
jgi:hypothetical protein